MSNLLSQETFLYKPHPNWMVGLYGLQVYCNLSRSIAMLIEGPGNKGVSVTNLFETLTQFVVEAFHVSPLSIWIQHYPATSETPAAYNLVTMIYCPSKRFGQSFIGPEWAHVSPDTVELVVGESVAPMLWNETLVSAYHSYSP